MTIYQPWNVGLSILCIYVFALFLCSCDTNKYVPNTPSYIIEDIPTPEGLKVETGSIGFMPDGRMIAGFWRGEIMTYDRQENKWKVFAKGLHNPLGLLVLNDYEVLVAQLPEITKLVDTDKDGEAELYENYASDFGLSGNFNEFLYGPVMDAEGNLYIALNCAEGKIPGEVRGELHPLGYRDRYKFSAVPYRGWVMKINPQGEIEPFASGFRSPDGIGFDGEGHLLVVDQQGDWVGTSPVFHVREDHFYGHPASLLWKDGWDRGVPMELPISELNSMRTQPAVQMPHGIISNSPTQPVCDQTNGSFGPFEGQIFIGEMNHERIIRVMLEEVGGELQGACIPFIDGQGLRKGNHRLAFGPDGSLWVGQNAHGWPGDEGIQRIVYTGIVPFEILRMNLTKTGFSLEFTKPIDGSNAMKTENFDVSSYYYEYHPAYGSDRYDTRNIDLTDVSVSADKKTINLVLPSLERKRIYQIELHNIMSAAGDTLRNTLICYTLNNKL